MVELFVSWAGLWIVLWVRDKSMKKISIKDYFLVLIKNNNSNIRL